MRLNMYSYNNEYPIKDLPHRIRLSNGMTKTDSTTFTEEDITYAGYRYVEEPPSYDSLRERLEWTIEDGIGKWNITQLTNEHKWQEIRNQRDKIMNDFEWRILRYNREISLREFIGATYPITDNIRELHLYMQSLADITKQEDPWNIVWPEFNSGT